MKCIYTENEIIGCYSDAILTDNYPEALKLYTDDIKAEAAILEAEQGRLGDAGDKCFFREEVCPVYPGDSIVGKVVTIDEKYLSPGYKDRAHQLFYVTGGFGAEANSRGNACYCYNLFSGESDRIERYQVSGYLEENELPDFAGKGLKSIKDKIKDSDKGVR